MAEINVVPYIDVMLVLLIIFMVTAPMLMQGVKVELPDAAAEPVENQDSEPLIVSVNSAGQLFLNLGADEERPPPTSFFRKYWHIILPLALLLLTTGEPEPTKVTKVAEKSD